MAIQTIPVSAPARLPWRARLGELLDRETFLGPAFITPAMLLLLLLHLPLLLLHPLLLKLLHQLPLLLLLHLWLLPFLPQ